MAFFGLTKLGHQDPFLARKLQPEVLESSGQELTRKKLIPHKLPPVNSTEGTLDSSLHQGSHEKCMEMVKCYQLNKSPNQTYRSPLTTSQQYGWWIPKDPRIQLEKEEAWIRTPRYPRVWSPMSKFVNEMTKTNPDFSLF
ncbi:sperm microtubule inner protein 11 isoform X2 [Microcaecilia unicolor]|uniref:Testis-expressed protein 49 isoform X2 n=1 Tax=Microcaecilia unicolor TaxID=1415580 RepID=A0A6P7XJN1_9AMPH|nr:testis-expressed protein 49 isoform X2 [Microcaecilia unicolor]